ncbi:hypothetical protein LPJ59_006583, partial [Coemansia sp. RSA 2399]
MDRTHQAASGDDHARQVNDRDLLAAIAAMCDDFGRHTSSERTRSWVSSAVSSVARSEPIERSANNVANELEDYVLVDSTSNNAHRKQQVRLTTINPVTANITERSAESDDGKRTRQGLTRDICNQEHVSKGDCDAAKPVRVTSSLDP